MSQQHYTQGQLLPEIVAYTTTSNEIMASVVFGTPSKNCEGIGICRMLDAKYTAGIMIKCPHVPGYLSLEAERGVLKIRFPKKFLTSQMVARHFCKRLFKVTESYKVPAHISRALGIKKNIQIAEGTYQVQETAEDLIVVIKEAKNHF